MLFPYFLFPCFGCLCLTDCGALCSCSLAD